MLTGSFSTKLKWLNQLNKLRNDIDTELNLEMLNSYKWFLNDRKLTDSEETLTQYCDQVEFELQGRDWFSSAMLSMLRHNVREERKTNNATIT